jgi:hydrogenase maturation protease
MVIGYGNEMRGDDGAGPFVAACIDAANLRGVVARMVRQLTPEMAADLAETRRVIFVDARAGSEEVLVQRLETADRDEWCAHRADPAALLGLTQAVFGRVPEAWWVTTPGFCFEVGEGLSPRAQEAARKAVDHVCSLIGAEKSCTN